MGGIREHSIYFIQYIFVSCPLYSIINRFILSFSVIRACGVDDHRSNGRRDVEEKQHKPGCQQQVARNYTYDQEELMARQPQGRHQRRQQNGTGQQRRNQNQKPLQPPHLYRPQNRDGNVNK